MILERARLCLAMPVNGPDDALAYLRDATEPIAEWAYVRIPLNGMLPIAGQGKTKHAI